MLHYADPLQNRSCGFCPNTLKMMGRLGGLALLGLLGVGYFKRSFKRKLSKEALKARFRRGFKRRLWKESVKGSCKRKLYKEVLKGSSERNV
jgi:hypothetical protein